MHGSAVGGKNPVLAALQQIMLARSGETREHCCRLAGLSWRLGRKLDLSDGQLADLLLLANLHDIGKIRIDGQILNKAGELTRWEREEIHRHPIFGFQIIRALPDFRHIADEILYHHEWWDGRGYPFGLAGEAIPFFSRILAVADAFDAMTHDRSYRKAIAGGNALAAIRSGAGRQFDPYFACVFIDMVESGKLKSHH
jgi:HD-GYP domain-containing protein (c-di-GMP phosphodiesterase class II)